MIFLNRNKQQIIINFILVFFVLSCIIYFDSYAQTGDYFGSKEIIVIIGETKSLTTKNPREVKIGNPNILDVVGAGRTELLLSGLAEGETQLVVVDDFGKHTYTVKVFQEDLEKLKERIDILLEAAGFDEFTTKIGDKERKIFITGKFPVSKKEYLESRIDSVKDKIINLVEFYEDIPSIEIDVEVLEVEKTALDNLGLSWNKSIGFSEGTTPTDATYDLIDPTQFFNVMKDWRTGPMTATLNFLKQRNKARTLSRPKIVCLSGKEAKLLVGGERSIVTGSTSTVTSAGTTTGLEVELKEYGITLTIKPTAKENNEIYVALQTEIRDIDTSQSLAVTANTSTPGFTTRSVSTELTVMDGQTVFLAGMIKSKHSDTRDSIAGLGSIPFLGALFRHKDIDKRDTEIVITLTPTIIRNRPLKEASSKSNITTSQGLSKQKDTEMVYIPSIDQDDPVVRYSTLIQNIIHSNIKYPQELKEDIQGTVKLSLHLLSDGKLLGVVVMQSSGNQLLDKAAEQTVKRLSPFPAFPLDVGLKELWIDIPIVYNASSRA